MSREKIIEPGAAPDWQFRCDTLPAGELGRSQSAAHFGNARIESSHGLKISLAR